MLFTPTNREKLDRWCERGILALVLSILVSMPLAFGGRPQVPTGIWLDFFVMSPFLLAQVLAVGVILLWAARLWLQPRPQLLWPPICWAVLAFAVYAVARYFTSAIEYAARQELILIVVYVFLFFAVLNNLHRQESIQIIAFTLIFLGMAISFYGIYQFLTNSGKVWHLRQTYAHRASGTYINPNHFAGFLEMLLPLALGYTIAGRLKPLTKVFIGYAGAVILAGILVSVSRGGWVASILSLILFFTVLLFHPTFRLPAALLLAGLVVGLVVAAPKSYFFKTRATALFSQGKIDDDLRFSIWEPAYQVWQENVLWGVGPAHFDSRFRKYRPEDVQLNPDRAHNDFLNTLADWGVVGAGLVAGAWMLLASGIAKCWPFVRGTPNDLGSRKKSNKFAFLLGALCGLAAIFFHSAVDFNMHIPANALVVICLMALLSSLLRFATERYWFRPGFGVRTAATVLLVLGSMFLVWQAGRRAMENVWLARASGASEYSPAQISLLERAYGIEPRNAETAYQIGEAYRIQSHEGGDNYEELAQKALSWFDLSIKQNPWDSDAFLRYGMCLDWLGRKSESAPYFDKADELDPNSYFTAANIGLHYVEQYDYAAARPWLERSLRLQSKDNPIALGYLEIVNRRLLEEGTNDINIKLDVPIH